MRITVLIENTPAEGLYHEHGLSLWLEHRDKGYLIDTGASGHFFDNARTLGIPVETAKAVILSHGHNDHTGGLERFLQEVDSNAPVLIRTAAFDDLRHVNKDGTEEDIGFDSELINRYSSRFLVLSDGHAALGNDMYLLGDHTQGGPYGSRDSALMIRRGGELVPDRFEHEQSLIIEGDDGALTLISPCSHSGIVNIVEDVRRLIPSRTVRNIIGGFHLMGADGIHSMNCTPGYCSEVINGLADLGVEQIWTGHCTGLPAFRAMAACGALEVRPLQTGMCINL